MKVLIVDDHEVLRQGVTRLLATIEGAEIHEAASAEQAVQLARRVAPSVVILDINLAGSSGLDLLTQLHAEHGAARIVMFTMYAEPHYVARALDAGATGFVSKSAPASELVAAVRRVASGERYISRELAEAVACGSCGTGAPLLSLTNREVEILRLLAEGKSLNEMASTFGVAYKTVANTCSRLKDKLGLERTKDLIRYAIESTPSLRLGTDERHDV
jgi:DNA-binding NarL/FixJ family response regulator